MEAERTERTAQLAGLPRLDVQRIERGFVAREEVRNVVLVLGVVRGECGDVELRSLVVTGERDEPRE